VRVDLIIVYKIWLGAIWQEQYYLGLFGIFESKIGRDRLIRVGFNRSLVIGCFIIRIIIAI